MMVNKRCVTVSRHTGEEGKSLIEIAIVVMIMAVVTAIALPAVANSIRSYNLRSAADHLAERMTAVRALAMSKNKTVTFAFSNVSGRYGFDFDGDGAPDTTDPDDPGMGGYYWGTLPDGVSTTFPGGAPILIDFNSRGELPIGALAQSIVLQSYGRSATVSVNLRGKDQRAVTRSKVMVKNSIMRFQDPRERIWASRS
jgi:type II secretory pathway pseudopilin PulG